MTRIALEEDSDGAVTVGPQRLAALSAFQLRAVLKAMTFPHAQRVVYSTCSVHREENEDVVARILEARPDFELAPCWSDKWTMRGLDDNMRACIRVDAQTHRTIGFFAAVFQRKHNAV